MSVEQIIESDFDRHQLLPFNLRKSPKTILNALAASKHPGTPSDNTHKMQFNPELASEMTWDECVACCLTKTLIARCADCAETRDFGTAEYDLAAESFIAAGWRYRRTKTDFEAVCPGCRKKPAARTRVKKK